jgi:ABC-type branched-subunit amino acid transport system ATPase component
VVLGTIIVPVLILQGVQYLPQIASAPQLTEDLGWIILGVLTIVFVFTRPQGLIPERRPRYGPGRPSRPAWLAARARVPAPAPAAPASLGAVVCLPDAPKPLAVAGDSGTQPLLAAGNLTKRYGGVLAVDGATFSVARGSVTGLIGPNGAGKSTVLGLISGFVRLDGGSLRFDGRDIGSLAAYQRARLGIVRSFQLPREFRALTTIENLLVAVPRQRGESLAGVALGGWRAQEAAAVERATALLELFGMAGKRDDRAATLSGGQKRMLEVMRALMAAPRLLLLDEPMAGLSPALAERLEEACAELARRGLTILLVEHELRAVERLCERVVVMAQGKVISEGRMAELRTRKEVQDAYVVG